MLRTEFDSGSQVRIGRTGQHKEDVMRSMRLVLVAMLLALPFAATATAQVDEGVGVGPAVVDSPMDYGPPTCDWGYYSYYPYACAPYGYYGADWFMDGMFMGVGPWYGWGWGGGFYDGPYVYDETRIAVDLFDAKSRIPIWHASVSQTVSDLTGPHAVEKINAAAAAIFAKFPVAGGMPPAGSHATT